MSDWEAWNPGWTYYVGPIWVNGIQSELNEIPDVRFVDPANSSTLWDPTDSSNLCLNEDPACTVGLACPAGAEACKVRWNKIETRFGHAMDHHHVYRVYLYARLKQDPSVDTPRCGTRRLLVPGSPTANAQTTVSSTKDPVTAGALDLSTPANLPAGCIVEEWVASVVSEVQRHVGGGVTLYKHSRAAISPGRP